jgi:cation diffusion facilitator CzcD-associated flavoprotein CzcO
MIEHDIIIIGGGQMGLALGYYLRRAGADFLILDSEDGPGGAWRHGWDSLRLFSPAGYSSLPGWRMPPTEDGGFPTRDDVIAYLTRYEQRYELPIERPVSVLEVQRADDGLILQTDRGKYRGKFVVSATGTWSEPYIPQIPGQDLFEGVQLHSAHYRSPDAFAGKTVLVVGGGNSGAQILAELSQVADATWVTLKDPLFLPDDVDGRVLFERATARLKVGPSAEPVGGIGDIVMVPPVKAARERGVLGSVRPFVRVTKGGVVWEDGRESQVDAIIWCTGFRAALDHLRPLGVVGEVGRVEVDGQRVVAEPRLWLAGYGDWCGPGSATIMGAARTARDLAGELVSALQRQAPTTSAMRRADSTPK